MQPSPSYQIEKFLPTKTRANVVRFCIRLQTLPDDVFPFLLELLLKCHETQGCHRLFVNLRSRRLLQGGLFFFIGLLLLFPDASRDGAFDKCLSMSVNRLVKVASPTLAIRRQNAAQNRHAAWLAYLPHFAVIYAIDPRIKAQPAIKEN